MNHIVGETKPTRRCSEDEKRRFYELLCKGFLGVSWSNFLRDFQEKEAVIVLRKDHHNGEIVGFSTLVVLTLQLFGEEVKGIFSGDTFVLPEYRGSLGMAAQLGSYFLHIRERFPQHKAYYILMSKGWRTYKIMPFLFLDFFPRYDQPIPARERAVMDTFGKVKYPRYYRAERGLIVFPGDAARLNPESIDAIPVKRDAHTQFFLRANPGYLRGDELVCVASVTPDNFATALKRVLSSTRCV
jgi:hypothetical protein